MTYSLSQLAWFFLIYSILGWCISVAFCAIKKHSFVNPGFLNLPVSPIYGIGAVLSTVFLSELTHRPLFFILGSCVLSGILVITTGVALERMLHRRWWDFSDHKFHFHGYISLPLLLVLGVGAWLCVSFLNPLLALVLGDLPPLLSRILVLVGLGLVALDLALSLGITVQMGVRIRRLEQLSRDFQELTALFGHAITRRVQTRMLHAFPNLEQAAPSQKPKPTVFAQGCSPTKLIWIFFIAALLGDIIETLFCRATMGIWMSRSSLIYGPFSIVWGLGAVMFTALLYRYKDKSEGYLFLAGTIVGGVYEYVCSVFTELVFGTVFWDYSHIPFNLAGRINLLYCFFWGIAAAVWMKVLYPRLSRLIERIPMKAGKVLTWVIVVFMVFNMAISALALGRYQQRQSAPDAPTNGFTEFLDHYYPDERIHQVYPNMKQVTD
ncbi:putative ABC transporter permease [Pseudoflavonifractor capillosus]|uniref:ABC transporter permease n=1 Tax=Candidatus Enterenecus faecium TaxID=2840780 RepID=A0A9D0YRZ2_9FIRM|nr:MULTISPECIES: putative ABC transporter permease [Pseudoflavonifractor]MBM6694133.1 putative ABC transporter permease [Pseudoflavonifractor capillosus]OUP65700.1 hypothetical protein B5F12_02010 [Pseudoflavonifractor sp. An176]HIQ60882.1 putative ABC transporter permease [Candidatus Enterenecus faecium]